MWLGILTTIIKSGGRGAEKMPFSVWSDAVDGIKGFVYTDSEVLQGNYLVWVFSVRGRGYPVFFAMCLCLMYVRLVSHCVV